MSAQAAPIEANIFHEGTGVISATAYHPEDCDLGDANVYSGANPCGDTRSAPLVNLGRLDNLPLKSRSEICPGLGI